MFQKSEDPSEDSLYTDVMQRLAYYGYSETEFLAAGTVGGKASLMTIEAEKGSITRQWEFPLLSSVYDTISHYTGDYIAFCGANYTSDVTFGAIGVVSTTEEG